MNQTKTQELEGIKTIEQAQEKNNKVDNFYKKIDQDKRALREKIETMKAKISEMETKIWKLENQAVAIDAPRKIWLGGHEKIAQEAFVGVTHVANLVNYETYAVDQVYKKNGKWVKIGIYYPSLASGGCDDDHPYIKETEVEI